MMIMDPNMAGYLKDVLQKAGPTWPIPPIISKERQLKRLAYNEKIRKIFERVPMIRGRNIILNMKGGSGEISITALDYTTLELGQIPNDSIIEYGLKYILAHFGGEFLKSQIALISPLFMRKIKLILDRNPTNRYQDLVNFMGVRSAFEKEWIFMPDFLDGQWYLIVIHHPNRIKRCRMIIIDPCFLHTHQEQVETLQNFLKAEFFRIQRKQGHIKDVKIPIRFVKIKQNLNTEDSGPFLLHIAQTLFKKHLHGPKSRIPKKMKCSSRHMLNKRKLIANALIESASKYMLCDARCRLPRLKCLNSSSQK